MSVLSSFLAACAIVASGAAATAATTARTTEAAEIPSESAFDNLKWETLLEDDLATSTSVAQSICVTPDYIIVMENIAEDAEVPDRVTAYYRNNKDENGDPVEQYSMAMQSEDREWEHCNGMAYDSNTDTIFVALYSNFVGNNEGCLYTMDPHTLEYTGQIYLGDGFNALGIGYKADTDQFVLQTDGKADYSMRLYDSYFNLLQDYGPVPTDPGTNFNDLAVSGDYVINSPLTWGMGIGEYMDVFSLSRGALVSRVKFDYGFSNVTDQETESLAELDPGVFLSLVNLKDADGNRKYRIMKTTIPMNFTVNVEAENGSASLNGDTNVFTRGKDATVTYQADEGYELASISFDGKDLDLKDQDNKNLDRESGSYTLKDVQNDGTLTLSFTENGKKETTPEPTKEATNGTEQVTSTSGDSIELTEAGNAGGNLNASESQGKTKISARKVIGKVFKTILLLAVLALIGLMIRIRYVRKIRHQKYLEKKRKDAELMEKLRQEIDQTDLDDLL